MRAPAGRACPTSCARCRASVWTHTTGSIPFESLAGKVVGVVGAGSSAFDAAAVALESGASEVHLFSRRLLHRLSKAGRRRRRPRRAARPRLRQHARAQLRAARTSCAGATSCSAIGAWRPCRSIRIERAVAFKSFHIHLNSSLSDVALAGNGKVTGRVGSQRFRFDHLIAATGYRIDLAAQPELARIHEHDRAVARPVSSRAPAKRMRRAQLIRISARRSSSCRATDTGAEFLRNIHCFNLAGALSFGIPVGDVPSVVDQPRLVSAIARDLYVEGVDVAVHERFINAPLAAPSSAPYERAVATRRTRRGLDASNWNRRL